jgi:hypothetical protein
MLTVASGIINNLLDIPGTFVADLPRPLITSACRVTSDVLSRASVRLRR